MQPARSNSNTTFLYAGHWRFVGCDHLPRSISGTFGSIVAPAGFTIEEVQTIPGMVTLRVTAVVGLPTMSEWGLVAIVSDTSDRADNLCPGVRLRRRIPTPSPFHRMLLQAFVADEFAEHNVHALPAFL